MVRVVGCNAGGTRLEYRFMECFFLHKTRIVEHMLYMRDVEHKLYIINCANITIFGT